MKTILIVDDKQAIAKILAVYFSGKYNTIWFDNPKKAIAWLNEGHKPDLIISDIRMPIMSGEEFLLYLKNNEYYKDLKVIILSAEDSTNERIRLLSEGAEDYIIKPFNPIELKIRISKLL